MIYLMNTTMMPNADGKYVSETVDVKDLDQALNLPEESESAIGHDSAAKAMSAVLGFEVPVNRQTITLKDGDSMLCLKLHERLPEGAVIDLETMNQIGYSLVWVDYQKVWQ